MKLHRAFLWVMIGSLSAAALLGIWAVLVPDFGRLQGRVLTTCLVLGLYAMPAFGCAVVLQRKRLAAIMWGGIAAALLAVFIWFMMIWNELPAFAQSAMWTLLFKAGFTTSVFTVWATHVGLLMLLPLRKPVARHARTATLGIVGVLAVLFLFVMWAEFESEVVFRSIAALSIAGICGTLVVPILALIELTLTRDTRESVPSKVKVDLTCPRCGSRQRLQTGFHRCSSCRLQIEIHVEEPRCTCGYLLYKLTTSSCPECGRAVPAIDRWDHDHPGTPHTAPLTHEPAETDLAEQVSVHAESDETSSTT